NSTVSFATSMVTSGLTDLLTLVVKDGSGNAVTGLTSSAFGFSLSGGTSAGTFGTVTETATKGTYTTTFTASTVGTPNILTATVSGVILNTKPTITVTVGPVNGSKSTVGLATATVASGSTDKVTIVIKDAAGNALSGLASSAFRFALSGGSSTC